MAEMKRSNESTMNEHISVVSRVAFTQARPKEEHGQNNFMDTIEAVG